ncbi:MAG: GH25 family lysozyme, partial [Oscillospiraceae bacterium]
MLKGIDVSSWQKDINWQSVKNSGIEFAILRAGFGWGKDQKDRYFEQNYAN